jgi:hypothetical protein
MIFLCRQDDFSLAEGFQTKFIDQPLKGVIDPFPGFIVNRTFWRKPTYDRS